MSFVKSLAAGMAVAASLIAPQAGAASTFFPTAPLPFELVNLRTTVDSCAFNPDTVQVVNTGTAIQVRMRDNNCLVPGTPKQVDIRLGAFPVGLYSVEVAQGSFENVVVTERLQFSVIPRSTIFVAPPIPFPLTDYTGAWWNPSQPGWGVLIHQSPLDAVFAAVFDYVEGPNAAPTWVTLQSGRWKSASTWEGRTIRTTGNPVTAQDLGEAYLQFDVPPPEGAAPGTKWAIVTHRLPNGSTVGRYITRMP
ncbi:hypothetical protein DSM104443_02406 [Usitatibacter rugosus]|uniref:Uncharacterized protein n=1 Tax=Usitatibacter rugosus TaxID=2732067 RepID=A0A6M4GVL2_9PROT|nr:hypothetical protein [Usitatibacter rugosus]QJR11331.1 hypothetical protein DSM104443_02406 [Usitatibacter rugosus]